MKKPFNSTPICDRTRRELMSAGAAGADSRRHLAECPHCTAFADRLAIAHQSLSDHRAEVLPDPSFAARVAVALPPGERDVVGRLALHLLPATVALALVLGAWCWTRTALPSDLIVSAPTDDVLSWVLENRSEQP